MMVLLRLTDETEDGKRWGLEKLFTTEQIDLAGFDLLKKEYELMKSVIEEDIRRCQTSGKGP